jgi:U3 small nucleolar RNA-associated protein 3
MVVEDSKGRQDGEQAYRPPKINPVSMEQDKTYPAQNGLASKEKRKLIQASRRAARSDFIQEFAAELTGAPEEKRMGAPVGMDTVDALRTRQRLAARENVEEELMIRVPLSKEERKSLKAQRRAGLSGKALLDDFADDIADLVDGKDLGIHSMHSRHKANQRYGTEMLDNEGRWGAKSGDDDLPTRESLHTRRAKMDNVKLKNASAHFDDTEIRNRNVGEETEFYKTTKKHLDSQRQQKRMKNVPDALFPPLEDPLTSGARQIDKAIEKNRGLTPHRRKDLKNPRKKHRIKYAEANIRRKGQVQSVKSGAAGAYGGESTGIKSKVSKSVKF